MTLSAPAEGKLEEAMLSSTVGGEELKHADSSGQEEAEGKMSSSLAG
jgi:hypothetical protein